ncbi:CocE/NonD family hydrolase [Amycolatopsis sp. NPDC024027]|uniref:CocE/NonD family hydrolase n=1 Tax=Amycolatopsis sp. NPDC024027 TaxID=3154327 RepID=UPI0034009E51
MLQTADNSAAHGPFRIDSVDDMTIEWDVPIPVDDGVVLRADVFRPSAPGAYPVILSCGPYGKGRPFQELMPPAWHKMTTDHPDILEGSSGRYQNFEVVDPEKWVPDGYVCVRVDSRGTGRSPGYLDPFSARETRDLCESIGWAAEQPWSNGRIGLNGISYLAMNQWQVAAAQPPHLAAICVWEGAGDSYRDASYHGGILTTFVDRWYGLIGQYGKGEAGGRNPHTGQLVCGDETFTDDELSQRRSDFGRQIREHPLHDEFHRARLFPDWTRIQVPVLSAGNWGGIGLHLRGNTRGFQQVASADKWLTMHEDTHFSLFYAEYGLSLQKRFFGHFLKDEDTGWNKQPRVELRTRHADGRVGLRSAAQWPLPETDWTRLYLDASDCSLRTQAPPGQAQDSYDAGAGALSFSYVCPRDIEIAGPVAAKLYVESFTTDADLFLVVRAFSPDGTEVVFQGANDPHVPVAQGWLRASHRALDEDQSRPYLPVHRHDRVEPLTPGAVYEVDVEILPTSLVLPAGYRLTLDVRGTDYLYAGADDLPTAVNGVRSAPHRSFAQYTFPHDDPAHRPADVYNGTVRLHTGGEYNSYLLLPIVESA